MTNKLKDYFYNLATDKNQGLLAALLKFFLFLASLCYGAMIRSLIFIYQLKPAELPCKVISVGNITLGGTGKTSLVELISRYLQGNGHKVAVLSRGYKKLSRQMGDEPLMLSKRLEDIPVIVDANRVRGAKRAVEEYGVDTVVLDDGLQQWRIKKDLEVVTISATQGFGNRHMLPRGILRQPLSTLKDAHIFVLTKTNLSEAVNNLKNSLAKINPAAPLIESVHEALGFYDINAPDNTLKLSCLKGKRAALLSGIGDPDSFAKLIVSLGIDIGLDLRFDDHHYYSEEDLAQITARCAGEDLGIIVTTEKDAARLSDTELSLLQGYQVLVLRVALKIIKNEEQFFTRLLSLYSL